MKIRKKCSLAAAVLALTAVCMAGCGGEKNGDGAAETWGPQIEGLEWGMSSEDAGQLYSLTQTDLSGAMTFYSLEGPVEIYGCEMTAELVFEEGYGLVRVYGQADAADIEQLAADITDSVGEKPSGYQINERVAWSSALAGEEYTSEQLREVYESKINESVNLDDIIQVTLASPLVQNTLYLSDSARPGWLEIDAVNRVHLEKSVAPVSR